MSQVSENARLTLIFADFAMVDGAGKMNIIGAGVAGIGVDVARGVTSRFSVVVYVHVPAKLAPVDAAVEIILERDGQVVQLPGPTGSQEPLRIGHAATFEKPQIPGSVSMRDQLESVHQIVLDFSAGLPLSAGGVYDWVLQVDGDEGRQVRYPFVVGAAPTPPVIG